jgi:hypothetical protein
MLQTAWSIVLQTAMVALQTAGGLAKPDAQSTARLLHCTVSGYQYSTQKDHI